MPNNTACSFKRLCGRVRTNDTTPVKKTRRWLKVQHFIKCLELCHFYDRTTFLFEILSNNDFSILF